ncbi:DUF4854 domain-containing protein [Gleimia sp. 6138-11-ORH1]|uniref:DUF4854 domain-containing protein n=1 Tax=Gleimia sp. 6138-11-ORH1 TaxID=2973937 RepID=UPI0021685BC0|nr:DUF4854 domain-containing protein [Gleimia sp. 6138-11-ORH1]MCS4484207.1 DUF4854 domain-containing protein [Gleimia sp. 6138-11-ORH1]
MAKIRQIFAVATVGLALVLSGCGSSNPLEDLVSDFNKEIEKSISNVPNISDFIKDLKGKAEGTDTLVVEITLTDNPIFETGGDAMYTTMGDNFAKQFIPVAKTEMKKKGIENGKVRVILKKNDDSEAYNKVHE